MEKTGQKETERGKKRQASDREEKTTKEKIFFGKKTKKFIEKKIGMRSRHWDIRKDIRQRSKIMFLSDAIE